MRIVVRRGLTVPLKGAPEQRVDWDFSVMRAGLLGHDLGRIRAELLVEPGQTVSVGTPLIKDRNNPDLLFCSPVSGCVELIQTAARRRLAEITIASDGADRRLEFDISRAQEREELRALLLKSGQWPALRARPFERIALAHDTPKALFVTAIDTAPHAPDPRIIIHQRQQDFTRGLTAVSLLTDGPTFLCQSEGTPLDAGDNRIKVVRFSGPHPAGLVGTHIARLLSPREGEVAWHIGYQDVIAIGSLLETGRIDPFRIISLSGPGIRNPRLVRVPLGTDLHALSRPDLTPGTKVILSGSVVSGRESSLLGRYDRQVTVIEHRTPPQYHWLIEALRKTQLPAAFIPTQGLEQSLGSDVPVVPLLRALSIGDVEAAERLGCVNLAEEDLALATYIAGGQTDFGKRLRTVLDTLEEGR